MTSPMRSRMFPRDGYREIAANEAAEKVRPSNSFFNEKRKIKEKEFLAVRKMESKLKRKCPSSSKTLFPRSSGKNSYRDR